MEIHQEHFETTCDKTISRGSGFIKNGLLTNFKKIRLFLLPNEYLNQSIKSNSNILKRNLNIINAYKKNIGSEEIFKFYDFNNNNFESSLDYVNFLKENYDLNSDTLFIFVQSSTILRTDFLPKILQYFNFLSNKDFLNDICIRSNSLISNSNDNSKLALDSDLIKSFPVLSNPFKSIFSFSGNLLENIIGNLESNQNYDINFSFLMASSLPIYSKIFTIPSLLSRLETGSSNLEKFCYCFLYGLTKKESVFLGNNKFYSSKFESYEIENDEFRSFNYTLKPKKDIVLKRDKKEPSIFALIPFKDHLEITIDCIDKFHNSKSKFELKSILIDNGSEYSSLLNLIKEKSNNYFRCEAPYNFSFLNNYAFDKIKENLDLENDYILLLNNDCILENSALENMLAVFSISEFVGGVGCKLFYPNRNIQHAGVAINRMKTIDEPHKFYHVNATQSEETSYASDYLCQTDGCTAACFLIKAKDYSLIRGFNKSVVPCAHSDSFIYSGIFSMGKEIIYSPFAKATHHESLSKSFYYPDDLESNIAFSLISEINNNRITSKQVI